MPFIPQAKGFYPRGIVQPWTPSDLSGLSLFLDASDAATVTAVGPFQYIEGIADKSPEGNACAQLSATNRPTYTGTSFLFDGVDDYMANATLSLAQPCTWFAVVEPVAMTGAFQFVSDGDSGVPRQALFLSVGASKWNSYASGFLSESGTSTTDKRSIIAVFNGASSSITVDGVVTAGNPGTDSITGYKLGTFKDAVAFFFNGHVYRVGAVNRLLTAPETALLQAYLDAV